MAFDEPSFDADSEYQDVAQEPVEDSAYAHPADLLNVGEYLKTEDDAEVAASEDGSSDEGGKETGGYLDVGPESSDEDE